MIAILFSVFLAGWIFYTVPDARIAPMALFALGLLFIWIETSFRMFQIKTLKHKPVITHLLISKNRLIQSGEIYAILFILLALTSKYIAIPTYGWVILFGVLAAAYHLRFSFLQNLSDNLWLVQRLKDLSIRDLLQGKDQEVVEDIQSLAEITTTAHSSGQSLLLSRSINAFNEMCSMWASAPQIPPERLQFATIYLLEKEEGIFHMSQAKKDSLFSLNILTSISKAAIALSQNSILLSNYALHLMSHLAKGLYAEKNQAINLKLQCVLIELAKNFVTEKKSEAIIKVIDLMEYFTKETFREDKSQALEPLTDPFREIKAYMTQDATATEWGANAYLRIDQILGEFEALDIVRKNLQLPPKDSIAQETEPV